MSFELAISTPSRPADLKVAWERSFRDQGFDVEIYPDFSPRAWQGGFLPFRVAAAPRDLIGTSIDEPIIGGFEISLTDESAHLRTASGRSTTDFALQCVGGATLAALCGGYYVDDQNGIACPGEEALAAAMEEVRAFLESADDDEKKTERFPGWSALG